MMILVNENGKEITVESFINKLEHCKKNDIKNIVITGSASEISSNFIELLNILAHDKYFDNIYINTNLCFNTIILKIFDNAITLNHKIKINFMYLGVRDKQINSTLKYFIKKNVVENFIINFDYYDMNMIEPAEMIIERQVKNIFVFIPEQKNIEDYKKFLSKLKHLCAILIPYGIMIKLMNNIPIEVFKESEDYKFFKRFIPNLEESKKQISI